jgi:hypothetical protein
VNGLQTQLRPLNEISPLWGELELVTHGREELVRVYHNAKMLIDSIVSTVYRRPRTIQEHVSELNGYIFDTCRPHSSGTSKADKFVSNYMGPHGNDISDVISSQTELSGID